MFRASGTTTRTILRTIGRYFGRWRSLLGDPCLLVKIHPQVLDKVRGSWVSLLDVLLQTLQANGFKRRRDRWVNLPGRRRWSGLHLLQKVGQACSLEWWLAREQFIK